MEELRELLRGSTEESPLDVAALQLATIEYPEVSVEPFLVVLDSYASEAAEKIPRDADGEEFLAALNSYLFEELEFQGNATDYYNPANSCLNEVLTKRVGIPITLSLIYIEIGRRLGRTLHGIGLPGHFIVQYVDPRLSVFLDPYYGGRVMSDVECFHLSKEITGVDVTDQPEILAPVSKRHIVLRMLNNLRSAYYRQHNAEKVVKVLDLLIDAMPDSAEEYKQRGICLAQIERYAEAQQDLETYLRLAPRAYDKAQVGIQLARIKQLLGH